MYSVAISRFRRPIGHKKTPQAQASGVFVRANLLIRLTHRLVPVLLNRVSQVNRGVLIRMLTENTFNSTVMFKGIART